MNLSNILAVVPDYQEILLKFGENLLVESSAKALRECMNSQMLSLKVEKLHAADGAFLLITLKKGKDNEERNL